MNLVALLWTHSRYFISTKRYGCHTKNSKEAGNEQEKCTKTVWLAPTQSWRKLSVEDLGPGRDQLIVGSPGEIGRHKETEILMCSY